MPFYLEAFQLKINLALVQFSFFFFPEKFMMQQVKKTYVTTMFPLMSKR